MCKSTIGIMGFISLNLDITDQFAPVGSHSKEGQDAGRRGETCGGRTGEVGCGWGCLYQVIGRCGRYDWWSGWSGRGESSQMLEADE